MPDSQFAFMPPRSMQYIDRSAQHAGASAFTQVMSTCKLQREVGLVKLLSMLAGMCVVPVPYRCVRRRLRPHTGSRFRGGVQGCWPQRQTSLPPYTQSGSKRSGSWLQPRWVTCDGLLLPTCKPRGRHQGNDDQECMQKIAGHSAHCCYCQEVLYGYGAGHKQLSGLRVGPHVVQHCQYMYRQVCAVNLL